MSLSVFFVLVSVTSILFYLILYLWWTPQKLRLTMVGAMLAAFATSFLLAGWVNRLIYGALPQSYYLLDGRLQTLVSGVIGSVTLLGALVAPLLIPRIRAAIVPENGVTLPLALGMGFAMGHMVSVIRTTISPEILELIADIRPEWIIVSAFFSPVQMTARYALAASLLSLAWPDPRKCVYAAIAGVAVLALMTGTRFMGIVLMVIYWGDPWNSLDGYAALYQTEIFLMLGLTILGLWGVDRALRRRKSGASFDEIGMT